MTQEDKQLLLKDLCARLPYGVKVQFHLPNYETNSFDDKVGEVFEIGNVFTHVHCDGIDYLPNTNRIKPYLRSMSSMTEEEWQEYDDFCDSYRGEELHLLIDWLNAHHIDYRTDPSTGKTMIEAGLALKAPEGMYKIK